ncbi:peptidase M4 family protein [Clostridium sp. P21]|uniref:Neutral metalloproteinase n=1 Tax=Clostridium muellerianum TaxID=2716538 RepID=A0A7Y0EJB0_9CLOT|nr:M4 family metallopeptidase [Clostridium muellerianum]NMM64519.1 peptidase M4 family protein [Clostridium muellerianum]
MKRNMLSLILTATIISGSSCFSGVFAKELNADKHLNNENNTIEELQGMSTSKSIFQEDKKQNVFLQGKLSDKLELTNESIISYLEKNESLCKTMNGKNNFKVESMEKDKLGYTKVKLNQVINNTPIKGSEIILHIDKDGIVRNIIGTVNNSYKKMPLPNLIESNKAVEISKKLFNYKSLNETPKIEKQIVIKNNLPILVYSVNIYYTEPQIGNWNIIIDAASGKILNKISNIRYDGAATGTGKAVDGSEKPLNLYKFANFYNLIDTTKPMPGKIKTYSTNNTHFEPGIIVTNTSNTFNNENFKASVSAHYNAGVVYDFYKNIFDRNSIDNHGMTIKSTTHYGIKYNNAFWDGKQMVYGDGDGKTFTYLSGDLDVVAHELTHGVTSNSANLKYEDQSGALNESFSDVFGVLVQTYDRYNVKNNGEWKFDAKDWVVGDEIYTPNKPGDALRSLADPTRFGQPDNMKDYVNTTDDNGGVHKNSGIPNKAAFLVAKAIGCDKTAHIYYRALTEYLTSNSDFSNAKNALVSAASDLYGNDGSEVSAIKNSFDSVGIK